MVMLEIPRDAAVLVSPGGRLRVLAPRDTPLPASKKLMSLDDQRSYVYLPGYKVTHDLGPNTQAPTLLFRGPLDGTNWEELHDDLCKTESRSKNRAARARKLSSYAGIDTVEYFLREPEHGGFFWCLCRGVDGRITIRSDTLGKQPVLYHRVPHDSFEEARNEKHRGWEEPYVVEGDVACDWLVAPAPAPLSDWPNVADGWKQHHPRHVLRIDTQTCALDPVAGTTRHEELRAERLEKEKRETENARAMGEPPPLFDRAEEYRNDKGEVCVDPFANAGVLPLVPPSLRVPPSHELDFIEDPDLPPELQKKPPKGLPIRLTEEGSEQDNAGILDASRELTKRFLAATKHAGLAVDMFRRGCEARPVGILFSGGIDSVAVLAACVAWKIPCVAAVAGFTGATAPPDDLAAAEAACGFFKVELLKREVGSVAEVAAALARLSPALCHLDVDKARLALSTYFAAQALRERNCRCVFSGGGAEALLNGVDGDVLGARASETDEASLELSALRALFHAELQRDHAAAHAHGMEIHHPFLSAFVAKFALDLPGRMKRLVPVSASREDEKHEKGKDCLRKRVLRVALERHPFNVPRYVTRRAPLKADVGSQFGNAVVRVAVAFGFARAAEAPRVLADAVAACASLGAAAIEKKALEEQNPRVYDYEAERMRRRSATGASGGSSKSFGSFSELVTPPGAPPKQFALLYTSGRNSAAAFHACLERRLAFAAIVPFSDPSEARHERFKRGTRHGFDREDVDDTVNVDPDGKHTKTMRAAAARFADAVAAPLWNRGVPGYTQRTRFAKTHSQAVTALTNDLVRLRADYGVLGVAHGHVFDVSALCAVEEASERAGLIALAPVWRDARATQKMLSSPSGAAGVLVVAGSPHSVGVVVTEVETLDALIETQGGAFATDGDACGTTFDAVPSEAAFYADAAVTFAPNAKVVADESAFFYAAPNSSSSSLSSGVGTREIRWDEVVVVRRPKPPAFVRHVGGKGWSVA